MADEKKPYEFKEGQTLYEFVRENAKTQTQVRIVEVAMTANGRTKHFVKIGQRAIENGKPGFEKSVTIDAGLWEGIESAIRKGQPFKAPKDTTGEDTAQAEPVTTKRTKTDQKQLDRLAVRAGGGEIDPSQIVLPEVKRRKKRSDSGKVQDQQTQAEVKKRKTTGK